MLKKTKILIISAVLLVLFCSSLCLFSCEKKQDSNKIKLIEVTHSVFYAPLYVAMENGYFEEEGLDISLTNGGGADNCMTALLTNTADIGLMGPEAAIYVLKEGKVNYPKIFAQLTKKDGSFLMSRKIESAFKWTDLENKEIIGGRKGGVPALTVEYCLSKNGLINGKNVTINYSIEYDLIGSAFTSGTGDYCTMFEPAATNMEKANQGYIVASVGEEAGEYPYTAFMALSDYMKNNSSKIYAFTRAIVKGMDYVQQNDSKTIAQSIISQFDGTTIEVLTSAIESYKKIDAYCSTPRMKEEDFDKLQDRIIEGKILSEKVSFDQLVDNSFIG